MAKEVFVRQTIIKEIKKLIDVHTSDLVSSAHNTVEVGVEQVALSAYHASDAMLSVSEVLARLSA